MRIFSIHRFRIDSRPPAGTVLAKERNVDSCNLSDSVAWLESSVWLSAFCVPSSSYYVRRAGIYVLVGQLIFKFIRWSVSLISQVIFQLRLPGNDLIFQFFFTNIFGSKIPFCVFCSPAFNIKRGKWRNECSRPGGQSFPWNPRLRVRAQTYVSTSLTTTQAPIFYQSIVSCPIDASFLGQERYSFLTLGGEGQISWEFPKYF